MISRASRLVFFSLLAAAAFAQAPTQLLIQDNYYTLKNFRFNTGESLPELKLHYLTLGKPHRDRNGKVDNAVLLLHGTGGSAFSLLIPQFVNVLFGAGQPLDVSRYYLILPDDIGHGQSSKPSDGLRMHFPRYDYDDMIASQHAMLLEALHVDHLRLILGTSMGCMETFVWGETFPQFADALVPMACLPVELAGRNRMNRYMAIQLIRADPAWNNGEYTTQPPSMKYISLLGSTYTSVPLQMQKLAPTRAQADKLVDQSIASYKPAADANDYIYFTDASRNYNPDPRLSSITAHVLWINSADDATNPAELGIAEKMVKRMPHAKFVLIPISDATRGHVTYNEAGLWKDYLVDLMKQTEKK
jgi:homoserine O-acetyltransferase